MKYFFAVVFSVSFITFMSILANYQDSVIINAFLKNGFSPAFFLMFGIVSLGIFVILDKLEEIIPKKTETNEKEKPEKTN